MKKRVIAVTTGTRAEYGFLRPLLKEIIKSKKLDLKLIVTGMHLSKKHGYTIREIKKDGFRIAAKIPIMPKGDSTYDMARTLGKGITDFSNVLRKLKPDINVILGDRDEALASAIAASHMNIPNAHIHGGDRSRAGIDEYNRHAITKISNIHFAATKASKERILKMGESPKFVYFTGSPAIDEIVSGKITSKNDLEKKYKITLKGDEIILLQHPVTTQVELSEIQILNTLKALARIQKTVIAIMPNSDAGNKAIIRNLEKFAKKYKFIRLFRTLPREDYLGLLKNCGVLVGNSSSGMIEGSYFSIPIVNVGIRQDDRQRGSNVMDVPDYAEDKIAHMISKGLKIQKRFATKTMYGDGTASKKIVGILEKIRINKEIIQKQINY